MATDTKLQIYSALSLLREMMQVVYFFVHDSAVHEIFGEDDAPIARAVEQRAYSVMEVSRNEDALHCADYLRAEEAMRGGAASATYQEQHIAAVYGLIAVVSASDA